MKGIVYFEGLSIFIKIILHWIENKDLRKICGPQRNEIKREWARLYKGQFCDLKR